MPLFLALFCELVLLSLFRQFVLQSVFQQRSSSSLLHLYFVFRDEFSLDDQLVANVHDVESDLVLHFLSLRALAFQHALVDHHFDEAECASLNDSNFVSSIN